MLILPPKESKALTHYITCYGTTAERAQGLDSLVCSGDSISARCIISGLRHHALTDLFIVCIGPCEGKLIVSDKLKDLIQEEVNKRWLFLNSYIKEDVRDVNAREASLPSLDGLWKE